MVHRSELGEEFRTDRPRNTSVRQGLDHLGLQHADFQTNRGCLPIVQLRSETFEACPHETGPLLDFEPETGVFVNDTAEVQELGRMSIPLASCSDHGRWNSGCLIPCS